MQLQEWIQSANEEVDKDEITSAVVDLFYRCDLVKECNGNTFEHLLYTNLLYTKSVVYKSAERTKQEPVALGQCDTIFLQQMCAIPKDVHA